MTRPDFFIIGAPRSGTSTLNASLAEHPSIFMAAKESHFFARDLASPRFIRSERDYTALFVEAGDASRVGEASVMYLYSRSAAAEMRAFAPEAQILALLRHPIDMMYSLHRHNFHAGMETIPDFEAALEAESDRRRGSGLPPSAHLVEGLYYRYMADYAPHLQRYIDVFGEKNVLVLIFEEFREDPLATYRRTLEFLGVSPDYQPSFRVLSPNKNVRSARVHRWLVNPRVNATLDRLRPAQLSLILRRLLVRLNTEYGQRPAIAAALRDRLEAELARKIQAVERLVGRSIPAWHRQEELKRIS